MSDILHYRGCHVPFNGRQLLGPDIYGAYYRGSAATYDADTDITTVTLKPIPPAELTEAAGEKLATEYAVKRLRQIFVGPQA